MVNPWFKFYGGEYLSDPKIASLSPQERSCWVTLMSLASISSTPGTIEFLTVEVLLTKSGIVFDPYYPDEWNRCLSVLKKFVQMKMITQSDDGIIQIMNWGKRQETALTNAERQAKYRLRNEKVTGSVTKVTLEEKRIDKNTVAETASEFHIEKDSDIDRQVRTSVSKKTTPEMKQVFEVFTDNPARKTWHLRSVERETAQVLFNEFGIEELTRRYVLARKYRNDPLCPQINKPSDFLEKMPNMEKFLQTI